jgi:hypothetical protein
LIERSASAFSRSSAARVRPPTTGAPVGSSSAEIGANVRHAARPSAAAVKMVRLRRITAAGDDWPRVRKTTIVAPISPASVNSCQG